VFLTGGHVDIGPHVALIAVVVGTVYVSYNKQWALAGYFVLTAFAMVARYLGADGLASAATWASLVLLAMGSYLLVKRVRAT
jgi:hypothetical protein